MNFNYKGYLLEIKSFFDDKRVQTRLLGVCQETGWRRNTYDGYDDLINSYKENVDSFIAKKEIEEKRMIKQEILMKTRGVFKHVTSCYYKDNTSTKNALVQVGYLDLDDNIVFNEPDEEFVGKPDILVRYLPGFMVRGYRSCEEYVPITNSHNGKDTKEINEVISQNIIQYSPSTYGNSPKVIYSVVGYMNDNGELIYYNQIANKE